MARANSLFVTVDGLPVAMRYFATMQAAMREVDHLRLVAGSALDYAYGIETGRTRRGRVARRLGGAFMVARGLEETQLMIPGLIVRMLEQGSGAGKDTTDAIRRTLLGHIQARTPVRTGRLRDSFVVKAGR